jgi:hypothetical protein
MQCSVATTKKKVTDDDGQKLMAAGETLKLLLRHRRCNFEILVEIFPP